jgi:hypothetical protein
MILEDETFEAFGYYARDLKREDSEAFVMFTLKKEKVI